MAFSTLREPTSSGLIAAEVLGLQREGDRHGERQLPPWFAALGNVSCCRRRLYSWFGINRSLVSLR